MKGLPVYYYWDYFARIYGVIISYYQKLTMIEFKVGLPSSKKNCGICFIESLLKMMKNAFYFILKALFVLKIFKFLSWLFGHVEKTAWLEREG